MDLSNPAALVAAFIAGISVLLIARLVYFVIKHVVHIGLVVGAILFVSRQDLLHAEELKNSSLLSIARQSYLFASSGFEKLRHIFARYDVHLQIEEKPLFQEKPLAEDLLKRQSEERQPDFRKY